MKIYVVRHGETDFNKKRILQGRYDTPLNEDGIKLAKISGEALQGIHFDEAFSSPLSRSIDTVRTILEASGNSSTAITLDERIAEVDVGDWTLTHLDDKENPQIKDINQFFKDPFTISSIPNGETANQVIARTKDFLFELASRRDEKTYLVGTHGFAMRSMLNCLYENPADFWHGHVPYNCCFNIIEVDEKGMRLIEEDKCFYQSEKKDYYGK